MGPRWGGGAALTSCWRRAGAGDRSSMLPQPSACVSTTLLRPARWSASMRCPGLKPRPIYVTALLQQLHLQPIAGQEVMTALRPTARGSPGLICISSTHRVDGTKMCSGDVPVPCSGDLPTTLWQLAVLQAGIPPEQVTGISPEQLLGENAMQFFGPIGPYGMR